MPSLVPSIVGFDRLSWPSLQSAGVRMLLQQQVHGAADYPEETGAKSSHVRGGGDQPHSVSKPMV